MSCKRNDVFGWRDKAGLPKHEQGPKARSGSGHYGIQRKDIANDEIMCAKKKEENREHANTDNKASLVVQTVKYAPIIQETWVQALSQEDPLEEGIAIHSSILAWRIPWTEEPGRLQYMRLHRVGHDWVTNKTQTKPYLGLQVYEWEQCCSMLRGSLGLDSGDPSMLSYRIRFSVDKGDNWSLWAEL